MRTILHELIHALGFSHEQNRPDRDDFVIVQWQNIQAGVIDILKNFDNMLAVVVTGTLNYYHFVFFTVGKERNFIKRNSSVASSFGVPYDQRSIMHYRSNVFSTNGQPTIIAKVRF